ncbi:MAG: LLM class flavin-dependent oxidoreductase, partial [Acidimicrobiales bacterium]
LPGLKPAVSAMPTLSVGGRSDAALVRAARYGDQWVGMWHDPETVYQAGRRLAELATKEDRPAPSVAMLVIVHVDDDIDVARREVSGALQGQYRLPLRVVDRWTAYGHPERVAEMLAGYRDAGVTELVLIPAAADPLRQYERLAGVRELVG